METNGTSDGPSTSTPGTDTVDPPTSSATSASTTEDGTSTEDDPTSEVTGSACPPSMQCLEAAPPDWAGPFVVAIGDGDVGPACPPEWPEAVSALHDELSAPTPNCACDCIPPNTVCMATIGLFVDGACAIDDDVQPSEGGGCTQTGGVDGVRLVSAAVNVNSDACTGTAVADIPALTWGTTASLCTWSTMPATCEGDGLCVPSGGQSCILREGDHACPEGVYALERTWWAGAMDTRDCSACTCGPPMGAECQGSSRLDLFESGDCSGGATDSLDIGVCGLAATSARYVPESLGECPVDVPSTPTGDAVPGNPVTLCCTE